MGSSARNYYLTLPERRTRVALSEAASVKEQIAYRTFPFDGLRPGHIRACVENAGRASRKPHDFAVKVTAMGILVVAASLTSLGSGFPTSIGVINENGAARGSHGLTAHRPRISAQELSCWAI